MLTVKVLPQDSVGKIASPSKRLPKPKNAKLGRGQCQEQDSEPQTSVRQRQAEGSKIASLRQAHDRGRAERSKIASLSSIGPNMVRTIGR